MSSQIKHRILGMFVVIALVILLLPFLQTEKDNGIEAAHDQTPAFPNQSVQMATDETITVPLQEIIKPQEPVSEVTLAQAVTAEETGAEPSQTSNIIPIASPIKADLIETSTHHHPKYQDTPKKQHKVKMAINKKHAIPASEKNGLLQLTEAAWVIQMGSFNSKSQALKLINQLRTSGYPAFMQTISTESRQHILVYVGPENGQEKAFKLADEIENEMQLRGMVISYQPLAL